MEFFRSETDRNWIIVLSTPELLAAAFIVLAGIAAIIYL